MRWIVSRVVSLVVPARVYVSLGPILLKKVALPAQLGEWFSR
jgi:hypothetical protein